MKKKTWKGSYTVSTTPISGGYMTVNTTGGSFNMPVYGISGTFTGTNTFKETEPDFNGDGVFDDDDLEVLEQKIKRTLKDGTEIEITLGEYYELRKMNKRLEDLTLEEYGELMTAIRL